SGDALPPAARRRLLDYVASKRQGGQDDIAYNRGLADSAAEAASRLGLDRRLPIVVLYSNVTWDAAMLGESRLFADQFEWLAATIGRAAERPDVQFVVRIHPAEIRHHRRSRQPVADELDRRFPAGYPDNVR